MSFEDLSNFESTPLTLASFLSFPNSVYPFFWAFILSALFIIITLVSFFKEREKKGRGNMLSSLALASFSTIILLTVGSVIGCVTLEILIPGLVICSTFIILFFFFNDS